MGVKTFISLDDINTIFPSYGFTSLLETTSGIIDTTYIAHSDAKSYILKKYERYIAAKINEDKKLLKRLKSTGLNVPTCLDENGGWYIYEKLQGEQPKRVQSFHIQSLARFLAKLHKQTSKHKCSFASLQHYEILKALSYTKVNHFSFYKKLEFLRTFNIKDGVIIHGDIFKDNTVFQGTKIGVFDFIDSICATFAFDAAVALVGFDVKTNNHCYINLFLNAYNQHAQKKLCKKDILQEMKSASSYYALKRINTHKNTKKAKELIK